VDKQSKVPLYLQLRDSVKYYISTGEIQSNQQLPTVNGLAKDLAVNFETVRKAYKELEREGLLSTKRGLGTFVTGRVASKAVLPSNSDSKSDLAGAAKLAITQLLRSGTRAEEIKRWVDGIRERVAVENKNRYVLFAECNTLQARGISRKLREHLQIDVRPILIKDLKEHFGQVASKDARLLALVTTGFHLNEVRTILGDHPVRTEFVITNMSPETRRKIEAFPKTSRFAFICRDPESIGLYKDTLKAELQIESDLPCCTLAEKERVAIALKSSDVLLVTPGAYNKVSKLAPSKLPIFNVIDHVDLGSLRIVKERILSITRDTMDLSHRVMHSRG
jgi:DNA-binding transcriptional regulator YhcF (GntR family)